MTLLTFTRKPLDLQMYCLIAICLVQPLISLQILLTLTRRNSEKSEVLTFHFFINIRNYRPKSKPCETSKKYYQSNIVKLFLFET